MIVGPVLKRLRDATGPLHARLDVGVRAIDRLCSGAQRGRLVANYHRFYTEVEAGIGRWLPDAPRRFASEDVEGLALASRGEALGALYVLEGSSLGGRMILRAVAARGAETGDLAFLDPYGARTGERWREFLQDLEDAPAAEAERGALAAFGLAETLLVERLAA